MRITIETERLLVMSRSKSLYSLCSACGDEVLMVTIDQAAAITSLSSLEIYREIEAGKLHFIETTEWSLLVCLNSMNHSNLEELSLVGTQVKVI
jgi:hypothetical protein